MKTIQMRTRMLPSMTNWEVEEYLRRSDIIIVPLGVNEMHGAMPLDIEYVAAEAYARVIAEHIDALVLPNLVYFSAGGTVIGRGTVFMSIEDSYRYTMSICHSLLNQGFRRIMLVPAHGNTKIFMNAVIGDFFDETKCPILNLDIGEIFRKNKVVLPMMTGDTETITQGDQLGCATICLGWYNICGRINDVPTGAEANDKPGAIGTFLTQKDGKHESPFPGPKRGGFDPFPFPGFDDLYDLLGAFMPTAIYFSEQDQHGSQPLPLTRQDVINEGAIGEKYIREAMEAVNWVKYADGLRKLDNYFQQVVLPKYGDHLPKNRFYPNIYK